MFKKATIFVVAFSAIWGMTLLPATASQSPTVPEKVSYKTVSNQTVKTAQVSPSSEVNLFEATEIPVKELPKPKPKPKPEPVVEETVVESSTAPFVLPPNLPAPEPGTAQAYAKQLLTDAGLGESEYSCLVSLWNRESGWNYQAMNSSSGAYGIPQSLPGTKMASEGADWQTNPETQIRWGLGYISGRYGTPCGAWAHSESNGWY